MLRSNLLTKILSLLIALVLSACNLPEPKETKEGDGSTFALTTFEGKVNSQILNQKTGLPSVNVYNYKACLTDLRQKKPMIGHKFEIVEAGQSLATDANGCLTWSENVQFDYLAASKYLKFTRTIKGLGPHFGVQTANFALDPWSHGEASPKDAVDLSKNTIPAEFLLKDADDVKMSLLGTTSRQKKAPAQLWLNMSRLAALEDRLTSKDKGFEINYDFQSTPQVKLNKMNGEQTFTDLTSGQLKGKLSLIHVFVKDGKMQRKVLTSKEFPNVQISNKLVVMSSRYNFEAPYMGHLYLAIQLTPTNDLSNLAPFEGLFYLGDSRAVNAGGFLLLSSLAQKNPNFTVDQFLAGSYPIDVDGETAVSTATVTTSPRGEKEDFSGKNIVAIPALRFGTPRVEEDSGHKRILKFQTIACMINPITQQTIRGLDFKVHPFSMDKNPTTEKTVSVTSQIDGCISWNDQIDVTDAYGCQQFIKGTVGFTNKDLGMDNRRVNIYVNPWDASFQVGADEIQYRTALGKECDGTKTLEKPSYLFVNGIQFLLKDIRHDLDSNLNLSVSRDFQVDLDAGVINNSSLHGPRDGSERLRDAQYLVRMVLTEDPDLTKNPRFITASDNIVESSSGKITIPRAAFKFINLLDMANRNRILFQILPVDRTKTTIATVKTSNNEDMKIMVPNAGLHYDDVIDHSTRLLPLIYDAKIILMGSERLGTNLVDNQKALMTAVMDGKLEFIPAFTELMNQRKSIMTKMIAQGLSQQKDFEAKIAAKSSLLDYARQLSTVLIDVTQPDSKNFKYLQKLMALDVMQFSRHTTSHSVSPKENLAKVVGSTAPLSKDQIIKALSAPNLSPEVAKRLCVYYMTELISPILQKNKMVDATALCVDPIQDTNNLFLRDKVYHVNKFNNFQYNFGDYKTLTLSNSFAQSYTFTNSSANTTSSSIGAKVPDFFIFSVGAQTAVSTTKQTAESSANSVNLTNSLPLTTQVAKTSFTMSDYETCYRLRLNPKIFVEKVGIFELFNFKKVSFAGYLDKSKNYQEVFSFLNRGMLICDRPATMKPLTVQENYYVVQQDPKESEQLDKGNPRNRHLFITLRGDDQFRRFETLAKSEVILPTGSRLQDLEGEEANQRLLNSFTFKPWSPRIHVEPLQ